MASKFIQELAKNVKGKEDIKGAAWKMISTYAMLFTGSGG